MARSIAFRRVATLGLAAAVSFALLAPRASAQLPFSVGGPGGSIPPVGTGGTAGWPLGVPDNFRFSSTATTSAPADAFQWSHLEIHGLTHTWVGDVQIVLVAPSGMRFNILSRPGFVGLPNPDSGNRGDFAGGTFTFVQSGGMQVPHLASNVPETLIHAGTYNQDFGNPNGGTWPSGTANIFNVPLTEIPMEPGAWRLWIYDWNNDDAGACTGWALHGLRSPQPYCTAGTSTQGCEARISATANPSVGAVQQCTIQVTDAPNLKTGLLFYGIDNVSWNPTVWGIGSSSFLCVEPPTQRTAVQNTGGLSGTCNGTLTLDWNAFVSANPAALGVPWIQGDTVYVQGWYRDPGAVRNTNLSDAIKLVYQP